MMNAKWNPATLCIASSSTNLKDSITMQVTTAKKEIQSTIVSPRFAKNFIVGYSKKT